VNPAPQGLVSEISLEVTNTSGSLILHWGALRPDKRCEALLLLPLLMIKHVSNMLVCHLLPSKLLFPLLHSVTHALMPFAALPFRLNLMYLSYLAAEIGSSRPENLMERQCTRTGLSGHLL
jgi:hypothetical protein